MNHPQVDLLEDLFATERVPEGQKAGRCPLFLAVSTWNCLPPVIAGTEISQFNFESFKVAIGNPVMFSWMESSQETRAKKNPCLLWIYEDL